MHKQGKGSEAEAWLLIKSWGMDTVEPERAHDSGLLCLSCNPVLGAFLVINKKVVPVKSIYVLVFTETSLYWRNHFKSCNQDFIN